MANPPPKRPPQGSQSILPLSDAEQSSLLKLVNDEHGHLPFDQRPANNIHNRSNQAIGGDGAGPMVGDGFIDPVGDTAVETATWLGQPPDQSWETVAHQGSLSDFFKYSMEHRDYSNLHLFENTEPERIDQNQNSWLQNSQKKPPRPSPGYNYPSPSPSVGAQSGSTDLNWHVQMSSSQKQGTPPLPTHSHTSSSSPPDGKLSTGNSNLNDMLTPHEDLRIPSKALFDHPEPSELFENVSGPADLAMDGRLTPPGYRKPGPVPAHGEFICPVDGCLRSYKKHQYLRTHQIRHHREALFCPQRNCMDRTDFINSVNMHNHHREAHLHRFKFWCHLCYHSLVGKVEHSERHIAKEHPEVDDPEKEVLMIHAEYKARMEEDE